MSCPPIEGVIQQRDIADFLTARYDMELQHAEEDHVTGCPMHTNPDADWRESCDCRTRRRLVDLDARRGILAEHLPHDRHPDDCRTCGGPDSCGCTGGQDYPCNTMRFLAAPYAKHPEYLEKWKP